MSAVHGTRACYAAGCRRLPCRAANAEYEADRLRQRAYGRHTLVDAEPARSHVRALMAAGMGRPRIARNAGMSQSAVSKLLYGAHGRPPSARIRTETARRLLAVQLDIADGATVDATGTQRRIQALVAVGWSVTEIGRRLGTTVANTHRLVTQPRVEARTARNVRDLYAQMWDTRPRQDTQHTKAAATRACRYAAARGWPPPAAWDDEDLDTPKARPHIRVRAQQPA